MGRGVRCLIVRSRRRHFRIPGPLCNGPDSPYSQFSDGHLHRRGRSRWVPLDGGVGPPQGRVRHSAGHGGTWGSGCGGGLSIPDYSEPLVGIYEPSGGFVEFRRGHVRDSHFEASDGPVALHVAHGQQLVPVYTGFPGFDLPDLVNVGPGRFDPVLSTGADRLCGPGGDCRILKQATKVLSDE